jgi:hypothetical protein
MGRTGCGLLLLNCQDAFNGGLAFFVLGKQEVMKKIFWITLILCLSMPLCVYAVDGSSFDVDKDGDVDGEDLAAFSQYFGKLCWYKDADQDGYSDGTKVWAESRPAPEEDFYSAEELTAL